MKKLIIATLIALVMTVLAFAGDAVLIQDQINVLTAQRAMVLRMRAIRPSQATLDANQDAQYNAQLSKLQAALVDAQASPSPTPAG